jgi:LysR family hydrogen peroxide-inducible transcriptional activator
MAVAVETRSAAVSVARLKNPQPARTVGMVWRKTTPLARQLMQISEAVCVSAEALREQRAPKSQSRKWPAPADSPVSPLTRRH